MCMPYWEFKLRIKQLERYNKEIGDAMKDSAKSTHTPSSLSSPRVPRK
jgi:hypothetical protein